MRKKHLSKELIIIAVITLVIIASNIILYNILKNDYTNKINNLNNNLQILENELTKTINNEKEHSNLQREILENKTLSNFEKLEDVINTETQKIKLDLETSKQSTKSELADISEQIGGLDKKISSVNVESLGFSAVINDVIKAVVSVKTNRGQGSGVIFDERGYIITNKHVIEGTTSITVIDYDEDSYPVRVLGAAKNADIAVLKIESDKTFEFLDFENERDIDVGDRVIAIGNPLGLSFTVTEGIVSATDRVIDTTGIGYIQTDVSINPGNSGGPLVNIDEKIVGINTLKIINTEGIGFAIPSDVAENIAEQAVELDLADEASWI